MTAGQIPQAAQAGYGYTGLRKIVCCSHCALTADEPWAPKFANIVEAWPPWRFARAVGLAANWIRSSRAWNNRRLCLPFAR